MPPPGLCLEAEAATANGTLPTKRTIHRCMGDATFIVVRERFVLLCWPTMQFILVLACICRKWNKKGIHAKDRQWPCPVEPCRRNEYDRKAVRLRLKLCTKAVRFMEPPEAVFTCSEGCSYACWIVTSLCGTASRLASSLRSLLPPLKVELWSQCDMCCWASCLFSLCLQWSCFRLENVFSAAIFLQLCAGVFWHGFWCDISELDKLPSMCCFCTMRACQKPLCKSPHLAFDESNGWVRGAPEVTFFLKPASHQHSPPQVDIWAILCFCQSMPIRAFNDEVVLIANCQGHGHCPSFFSFSLSMTIASTTDQWCHVIDNQMMQWMCQLLTSSSLAAANFQRFQFAGLSDIQQTTCISFWMTCKNHT